MSSDYHIDKVDRQILALLIENARMPFTEIAQKILVSPGTIHVRMKKLEQMGVVQGSEIIIDPAKIGYDLTAFIGIYLNDSTQYQEVLDGLKSIPEVIEAYYTTGGYGIFIKVICKNTAHLREILNDKIQALHGIHRTETMISLEQPIRRKAPLEV